MAEGGGSSQATRETSPKAVVDTSPLHIDQNKESLKVKLMLRRPLDQLVAQGIMPPHKTPAAYHGQRRQLERAKTGDLLKAKIQQRPSRQELERRHILELDLGHVDPSLAERQRMLKKARLADQLNDQLSHRPGPLELIRKNILHTEEPIEQAVKTGIISYKATSEGQLNRPQLPSSYITPEDDSQSSAEGDLLSPGASDAIETAAKSAGIVVSLIPATEGTVVLTTSSPLVKDKSEIVFADICRSVTGPLLARTATSPASLGSTTSTLSPLSSVASPVPTILSQPSTPIPPPLPPVVLTPRPLPSPAKSDAPGKDKNRKKSKSKSIPKARTIKFHEYKGPPSAQKNTANNNFSGESSYELLLQQQTLFLQFQLQLQHKFPQIILPASQESQNENSNINQNNSLNNPLPSPAPSTSSESSSVANRVTGRLEDMKVSDLKAELKRRNLPVSGSKPQLIERLKLFSNNQIEGCNQTPESVHSNSSIDQPQNSPTYQEHGSPEEIKDETTEHMEIGDPSSPLPTMIIKQEPNYLQNQKKEISQRFADDLVKEQQRKIHELQRELTLSQLKLQAATRSENKAQVLALQKHLHAKQQQQATSQIQQLQARQARQLENEEEQKRLQQQQQQHVAFQNQKNLTNGLILNGVDAQLILNQLIQGKVKLENNNQRSNSLPNFFNSIVTPIIPTEVKNGGEEIKPPPLYEEATKQLIKKNNVKSQIVDDVLEILIKNGELPPSAAQEPVTPNSAEIKTAEPVYTEQNQTINDNQDDLGLDPNELLNSLENLDNMDLSQFVMDIGVPQQNGENNNENDSVPMDTDEWLESLLPSSDNRDNVVTQQMLHEPDLSGYDPLLGISHDPFDPFNLDEFRSTDLTSLSWDKLDYAA